MANDTPKWTDQAVLHRAHTLLAEPMPLQADGYSCTTDDLLDVLLGVAVSRGTIEAVCADLVGTSDADRARCAAFCAAAGYRQSCCHFGRAAAVCYPFCVMPL